MNQQPSKLGTFAWSAAIMAGLIMLAVAVMGGCQAHTRLDPQKAEASVTTTDFDGQSGKPVRTTVEKVTTQGPGGQSTGDNAHVDAKGKAPALTTKNITTDGGTMDASGDAEITKSSTARIIVGIIGGILMLAGGVGLYLRQPVKASSGTIAIGFGLIACAVFPNLALYILLALALHAAASLWLTGWDAAKFREALRATRAGIADLATSHPDAHDALTNPDPRSGLIATHADPADLKTNAKIDLKDGLKN